VYIIVAPASTVAGALFVIVTSALVVSCVFVLAVRGLCGSVVESTVMLFVMFAADGGDDDVLTPSVIVVIPTGISAIVHVTVPFAPTAGVVHDHPGAVILLKRSGEGSTSVNVRSPADDGP